MSSADRRRVLIALASAYVTLAATLTNLTGLASLRKTVKMSETVTSLHGSFFGWALIALALSAGVTGQLKRSTLFRVGLMLSAAGALPFALATNVGLSLTGAALSGAGAALLVTVMPAITAQRFPLDRAAVFARLNTVPVTMGLSLPLVLVLFDRLNWSWRLPILFAAPLAALFSMIASAPLLHRGLFDNDTPVTNHQEPNDAQRTKHIGMLELLRRPTVRARFVLQVLSIAMEFGVGTWMVVYFREAGDVSAGTAPIAAVAWGLGMLSIRVATPPVIRKVGRWLEAVSFLGFAAAVFVLTQAHSVGVLLFGIVAAAIGVGHLYSLGVDRMYVTAAAAGIEDHDAVSRLAALASGVAISVGPLVIGSIADRSSLRTAMAAPFLTALACSALALMQWQGEAGRIGTSRPGTVAG